MPQTYALNHENVHKVLLSALTSLKAMDDLEVVKLEKDCENLKATERRDKVIDSMYALVKTFQHSTLFKNQGPSFNLVVRRVHDSIEPELDARAIEWEQDREEKMKRGVTHITPPYDRDDDRTPDLVILSDVIGQFGMGNQLIEHHCERVSNYLAFMGMDRLFSRVKLHYHDPMTGRRARPFRPVEVTLPNDEDFDAKALPAAEGLINAGAAYQRMLAENMIRIMGILAERKGMDRKEIEDYFIMKMKLAGVL